MKLCEGRQPRPGLNLFSLVAANKRERDAVTEYLSDVYADCLRSVDDDPWRSEWVVPAGMRRGFRGRYLKAKRVFKATKCV